MRYSQRLKLLENEQQVLHVSSPIHNLFELILAAIGHFALDYIEKSLKFLETISEEGLEFLPHY